MCVWVVNIVAKACQQPRETFIANTSEVLSVVLSFGRDGVTLLLRIAVFGYSGVR